jgi:hypothetical protein
MKTITSTVSDANIAVNAFIFQAKRECNYAGGRGQNGCMNELDITHSSLLNYDPPSFAILILMLYAVNNKVNEEEQLLDFRRL